MFEKLKAAFNLRDKFKGLVKEIVVEVVTHTEVTATRDGVSVRFRDDRLVEPDSK